MIPPHVRQLLGYAALRSKRQSGYTLTETIAVVVMVGILAALATPSFLGLVRRQKLNDAVNAVRVHISAAQRRAKRMQGRSQITLRVDSGELQYAIHEVGANSTTDCDAGLTGPYQTIIDLEDNNLELDAANTDFTQSSFYTSTDCTADLFRLQFSVRGAFSDLDSGPYFSRTNSSGDVDFAKIVLKQGDSARRCVFVTTLIGNTRIQRDDDCLFTP